MTSVDQHHALIASARTNPSSILTTMVDHIESAYKGTLQFSDPTNPLVHLMEIVAMNTAAGFVENEAAGRRLYPVLATTYNELYNHMSDKDVVDIFAVPASTTITLLLQMDMLRSRAPLDTATGIRRLTVPRNTVFTVGGLSFTMHYPIDIRVMPHTGLQVTYDNNQVTPLKTLDSNAVQWSTLRLGDDEYLRLDIPVDQFTITSHFITGSLSEEIAKTFSFTDDFYYARVWDHRPDGSWRELQTTFSQQVYDPLVPTALLRVEDNKVTVTIPSVYTFGRQVSTSLRLDLYTTRGPLNAILSNYRPADFTLSWKDNTVATLSPNHFGAVNFESLSIFADATVTGGRAALSFEELRERVLLNAIGPRTVPISNVHLESRLRSMGYDSVKDLDVVTNRDYLAVRELPALAGALSSSSVGVAIHTLSATFQYLAGLETSMDNGDRLTLLPSTLYEINDGLLGVVSPLAISDLQALAPDLRARMISQSDYYYTPFHYVMDSSNNRFDARCYYLDNPRVVSKWFVEDNETLAIDVAVDSYQLTRTEEGYTLYVSCRSGDDWKNLADGATHAQLSFQPKNERDRAYLNGTLAGMDPETGERIYSFDITTNYDLDSDHHLCTTSFSMYSEGPRSHFVNLEDDFDIVFAVTGFSRPDMRPSTIDEILGTEILPLGTMGITRERLRLKMGESLAGLWSRTRTTITEEDYRRHEVPVYQTYTEIVYERDAVTGHRLIVNGPNGSEFVIKHNVGDPVLDSEGDPIVLHRVGDVVYGTDGMPEVLATRGLLRQVDLTLFDGTYYFSDNTTSLQQALGAPEQIMSWLRNEIDPLRAELLERTNLFFHPKRTMGQVPVIVGEERETFMDSHQRFDVVFFVNGTVFRDAELRKVLSRNAIQVIDQCLRRPVVSLNLIYSQLTATMGSDVIGLEVKGLSVTDGQSTVTIRDNSSRLSIRKHMVVMPDNTLGVEEDVSISFIQHTP